MLLSAPAVSPLHRAINNSHAVTLSRLCQVWKIELEGSKSGKSKISLEVSDAPVEGWDTASTANHLERSRELLRPSKAASTELLTSN